MFKKVLIADRGELAARIIHTCRDMGSKSAAFYSSSDLDRAYTRLADECIRLASDLRAPDPATVIRHALEVGADAIHPGYVPWYNQPAFARACEMSGLAFIGPSSAMMALAEDKVAVLNRVQAAGFATTLHSTISFGEGDRHALYAEAARIGYPLVLKLYSGAPGSRVVRSAKELDAALQRSYADARVFGCRRIYLERAILPVRCVEVQILGDRQGQVIHLGEYDHSFQHNHLKLIAELPAPYLAQDQREQLWSMSLQIAQVLGCCGAYTVRFLVDAQGQIYFAEIKPSLRAGHVISEMVSTVDIVREQMRLVAGESLAYRQADVRLLGCALQCRINGEEPEPQVFPGAAPTRVLPHDPYLRVDTHAYGAPDLPAQPGSVGLNLVAWGADRAACVKRMQRALQDLVLSGAQSNIGLLRSVLNSPSFMHDAASGSLPQASLASELCLRDLAVLAAIAYVRRTAPSGVSLPKRLQSGWHQRRRLLT